MPGSTLTEGEGVGVGAGEATVALGVTTGVELVVSIGEGIGV